MLLEEYGLIGDVEAAAVVGRNAAIGGLYLARFDSWSCCSALLVDVFERAIPAARANARTPPAMGSPPCPRASKTSSHPAGRAVVAA